MLTTTLAGEAKQIMIEQIKQHFACGDTVEQIKDFKLRRLQNKLNEGK